MHVHTHTCMYTHTHTRSHTHAYTCMYTHIHSLTQTYNTLVQTYMYLTYGQMKLKPVVINDYNQHNMLGVDKLDQFARYYSFLHTSVKWWRKTFWMLEVAVINSYITITYKKLATSQGRQPVTYKAFCRALIDYLSEPLRSQGQQRARRGPPPDQNLERLHQVCHTQEKGRRRRLICSDRTSGGTRHLTLSVCYLQQQAFTVPITILPETFAYSYTFHTTLSIKLIIQAL